MYKAETVEIIKTHLKNLRDCPSCRLQINVFHWPKKLLLFSRFLFFTFYLELELVNRTKESNHLSLLSYMNSNVGNQFSHMLITE